MTEERSDVTEVIRAQICEIDAARKAIIEALLDLPPTYGGQPEGEDPDGFS